MQVKDPYIRMLDCRILRTQSLHQSMHRQLLLPVGHGFSCKLGNSVSIKFKGQTRCCVHVNELQEQTQQVSFYHFTTLIIRTSPEFAENNI